MSAPKQRNDALKYLTIFGFNCFALLFWGIHFYFIGHFNTKNCSKIKWNHFTSSLTKTSLGCLVLIKEQFHHPKRNRQAFRSAQKASITFCVFNFKTILLISIDLYLIWDVTGWLLKRNSKFLDKPNEILVCRGFYLNKKQT